MATMTMDLDVSTATEQDVLSTDNLPTPEIVSKYRLAGHFCSVAMKAVLAKCVAGINCKELCHFGDETILSQVRPND
jgi:methionine aminopeptidase